MKTNRMKFIVYAVLMFFLFMLVIESSYSFLGRYITVGLFRIVSLGKYGINFLFELVLAIIALIIVLLSKNHYIFLDKKENIFKSVCVGLPIFALSVFIFAGNITDVLKTGNVNIYNVLSLILYTITIGIVEEFFCRAWLLNEFLERYGNSYKGVIKCIIVSALLFGLIHWTNVLNGQTVLETATQIIQATAIGVVLGAIYYRTKNIWSVVFLHAFWDFAIMFSDVNLLKDCVSLPVTDNLYVLSQAIFSLGIAGAFLAIGFYILRRSKVMPLIAGETLTQEDIKKSKKAEKILVIVAIACWIGGSYLGSFVQNLSKVEDDDLSICYSYNEKKIKDYETHYYSYDHFNVSYEDINFEIKLNDGKVRLINKESDIDYSVDIDNVLELVVLEKKDYFAVMFYDGDSLYFSNYLVKENMSYNNTYLSRFNGSFMKIGVPDLSQLGYLTTDDNSYLMLVSSVNDKYILDDAGNVSIIK